MAEGLRTLRASVRLKDGSRTVLHQRDSAPENAEPDDLKRLRDFGHLGELSQAPPDITAEDIDLTDATDVELEAYVASANSKDVIAAASTPRLAQALLEIEEAKDKPRVSVVSALEAKIDEGQVDLDSSGDGSGEE